MRKFSKYIASAAIGLLALTGITSCQDDFDSVDGFDVPVATLQPNTTIAELKSICWDDSLNYSHEVGLNADGEHYIVKGRVISSDEDGNIYRAFYIADETGAICVSLAGYDLWLSYRPGQEIVIDMTGLFVGKYRGLMQIGSPKWEIDRSQTTSSFMSSDFFTPHVELNGMPDVAQIDTLTLRTKPGSSKEELIRYQGLLVRFNNSTFAPDANGIETLCNEFQSSGYTQKLNLADGSSVDVRTSGYADFWNTPVPKGAGDVVGILGYYNSGSSGDWQLLLIDAEGLMNFGNPTVEGDKDHPYTVEQAINFANSGYTERGWVSGYIVGTVAPEVTEVKSNADIQWTAPFIMANTVVIADEADCNDYEKCLLIQLPEGSMLAAAANLVDNEALLGRRMGIEGRYATQLGMAAVDGYKGTSSEFFIEGVDLPDDPNAGIPVGTGSKDAPYNPTQVLGLGNPATTAWIKGYIVGSAAGKSADTFTTATGAEASNTNIFIATTPDETDYTKCIPVQLPAGDVRNALNLQQHPENLGATVAIFGSLEKYFGMPGVKTVTEYDLAGTGGDTPTPPVTGDGTGEKDAPYSISQVLGLGNPGSTSWIKGYIVGSAPGMSADTFSTATGADASNTNVFLADSPNETDYTKCVPVQLPSGAIRNALSLQQHPENLGKQLIIFGSLEKYFGMPGLKSATEYELLGSGSGEDPNPPVIGGGSGTQDSPYGVAQAIALGNPGTTAWVKGYIVGSAPGMSADTFSTATGADASNTNIFIADSPSETDYTKCIPVQLPAGDVRNALSLQQHPENLGKEISINGSLEKYFGMPGLKSATEYTLSGSGSGGEDPNPPVVGGGSGSQDSPYGVAEAIALGNPGTTAWVKGFIVGSAPGMSADTFSTATGAEASNTNIFIADSPSETDYTKCIPVQLPAGDVRNALSLQQHPENLGKEISINGSLEKYFGMPGLKSAKEFTLFGSGSGGEDPNPPVVGGGDGTQASPYEVGSVLTLGNPGTKSWVEGYIVGFVSGQVYNTGATFSADNAVASNVLLAASASETDPAKCIPVQLPSKSDVRAALNLIDNPGNIGRKVKIEGTLSSYFSVNGVKSVTAYEF